MKYIRIFFTFLGYITFIAIIGAGTFWYVGMKKAQAKARANAETSITFQDNTDTIAMKPQKQTLELIDPTPISRPDTPDHLVDPPAKRTKKAAAAPKPKSAQAPKPTPKPEPATKPVAYAKPAAKPKQARPKRTRQTSAPIADAAPKPELGTSILRYQVTDRAGRERTGHGVVNMDLTSDLENAAIRRARAINELAAAADKIRNPQQ